MKKKLTFKEIDEIAIKLASYVEENTVIALIGDLGTGKTSFSKAFAKALNVKENIKSPTFNYVLEYLSGRIPFYHFDVYRLSHPSEVYEIGYEDYLSSNGVCLIEWADTIESELPCEYIEIRLSYPENDFENSRIFEINYIGNKKKEDELLRYVNFGH